MTHELSHYPIPFASFWIPSSVLFIGRQFDDVWKSNFLGQFLQQVDAKAKKASISSVILPSMHHDVWDFLDFLFVKEDKSQVREWEWSLVKMNEWD